jgi:hypothetical protein
MEDRKMSRTKLIWKQISKKKKNYRRKENAKIDRKDRRKQKRNMPRYIYI